MCVNFLHKWRDLQFKIDCERQLFMAISSFSPSFCQKSAERKSPKKYFSYFDNTTHYRLDHGDLQDISACIIWSSYWMHMIFWNSKTMKKIFIFSRIRICRNLEFKSFITPCSRDRKCKKYNATSREVSWLRAVVTERGYVNAWFLFQIWLCRTGIHFNWRIATVRVTDLTVAAIFRRGYLLFCKLFMVWFVNVGTS